MSLPRFFFLLYFFLLGNFVSALSVPSFERNVYCCKGFSNSHAAQTRVFYDARYREKPDVTNMQLITRLFTCYYTEMDQNMLLIHNSVHFDREIPIYKDFQRELHTFQ